MNINECRQFRCFHVFTVRISVPGSPQEEGMTDTTRSESRFLAGGTRVRARTRWLPRPVGWLALRSVIAALVIASACGSEQPGSDMSPQALEAQSATSRAADHT